MCHIRIQVFDVNIDVTNHLAGLYILYWQINGDMGVKVNRNVILQAALSQMLTMGTGNKFDVRYG